MKPKIPDIPKIDLPPDIEEAKKILTKTLLAYKSRCKRVLERASSSNIKLVEPLPHQFAVKNSIITSSEDGVVIYTLPFTYAPKYLSNKEIKNPERLQREIFINFMYAIHGRGGGRFLYTFWLSEKDGRFFKHYHGSCKGTLKIPPNLKPEELPKFRDQIEVFYENINTYSLASREPMGLPSISSLKREGKKKNKNRIWRQRDLNGKAGSIQEDS